MKFKSTYCCLIVLFFATSIGFAQNQDNKEIKNEWVVILIFFK